MATGHSGSTKGGQKPKISSTLPPKRRFGYISAELRGHLGNVVFIPKGALHSVRNIHQGTSVWLYGYD